MTLWRSHMFLRQIYHDGLTQASYLIGCQATGEAVVIDPNRNIEQYLAAAQRAGLRITAVTETHIHADYVSGARAGCAHWRAAVSFGYGADRVEVCLRG